MTKLQFSLGMHDVCRRVRSRHGERPNSGFAVEMRTHGAGEVIARRAITQQ